MFLGPPRSIEKPARAARGWVLAWFIFLPAPRRIELSSLLSQALILLILLGLRSLPKTKT